MSNFLKKLFGLGQEAEVEEAPVSIEEYAEIKNRFGEEKIITNARHYSEILLRPEFFPEIRFHKKPENDDFVDVKWRLVEEVFRVVKGHYLWVTSLEGIDGKEGLQGLLESTIKEFIAFFWDMPASEGQHHAHRFGLLCHSLETACRDAENAASHKFYSDHGLDNQRIMRERGKVILAYFFAGLFHDTHKIYDYQLTHVTKTRTVKYLPQRGGLLNFKMLYQDGFQESWIPSGELAFPLAGR